MYRTVIATSKILFWGNVTDDKTSFPDSMQELIIEGETTEKLILALTPLSFIHFQEVQRGYGKLDPGTSNW